MKKNGNKELVTGGLLLLAFCVWTAMIQLVDVQPIGQNGTLVGFAALNRWFHEKTGVHMAVYTVTDWLGLVPVFICMVFGGVGLAQWIKRRSLWKVDKDFLFLGIYYVLVIFGYLIFEMIPINYRPILINGFMEASYPSSTTLLVLSVMPTLSFQVKRRVGHAAVKKAVSIFVILFSAFMVLGRTVAGVHWLTDIIGSVLLSAGIFDIYKAIVLRYCNEV